MTLNLTNFPITVMKKCTLDMLSIYQNLKQTVKNYSDYVSSVSIRNQSGKIYLTVTLRFIPMTDIYQFILEIRKFISRELNRDVRMTSGGGMSATFRIN